MTSIKDELLQVFLEESLPLAEQVAKLATGLEANWAAGLHEPKAIATMQAALHTIKGNAGMLGFAPIGKLVHAMEDALGGVREAKRRTLPFAQLWVETADRLVTLVSDPKRADVVARADEAVLKLLSFENASVIHARAELPGRAPEAPRSIVPPPEPAAKATSALTVRVDFTVLDALLEGLGEAGSMAANLNASLHQNARRSDSLEALDAQSTALLRELRSLRALVMRARLVPIAPLLTRLSHLARDLARQRGLQLRWQQSGDDTSIDKAILDRLSEPLLHVVRNAIAHGVEPPSERLRQGKPEVAAISVRVRVDRDRLAIDVRDDGRGIDATALRARAAERGVAVDGLTREQALRLVFMPGLSTAKVIDDLAGRGVGLDAVERVIRELDGDIRVASEPGRGTHFEIVLPSAISLLSGLVVRVDREAYVVPDQHIVEAVTVAQDSLCEVNGRTVFAWRELLPVIDARQFLSVSSPVATPHKRCLVLEVGRERCALLVSHVDARIEGVVKPLDSALCASRVISGATILPDGRVLPIIDARRAIEASSRHGATQLAVGAP